MWRTALSLASRMTTNGLEFSQQLLRAHAVKEVARLQADFARSQMNALAEQAGELGDAIARSTTDVAGMTASTAREFTDWSRMQVNWDQFKNKVKERWHRLTDEELAGIAGSRDQLEAKIQGPTARGSTRCARESTPGAGACST